MCALDLKLSLIIDELLHEGTLRPHNTSSRVCHLECLEQRHALRRLCVCVCVCVRAYVGVWVVKIKFAHARSNTHTHASPVPRSLVSWPPSALPPKKSSVRGPGEEKIEIERDHKV